VSVHINLQESVMIQTRQVYLTEEVDFCVDLAFDIEMLASLNKNPITLYINSNGGSVSDGIALIRVIEKVQKEGVKVIGIVRGQALSMAFLILEVCEERRMGSMDLLMAHGITTFLMGDIKDIDAQTKVLGFWREKFALMLQVRSNKTFFYWSDILASNTPIYFTPEESLEYGLVDKIE